MRTEDSNLRSISCPRWRPCKLVWGLQPTENLGRFQNKNGQNVRRATLAQQLTSSPKERDNNVAYFKALIKKFVQFCFNFDVPKLKFANNLQNSGRFNFVSILRPLGFVAFLRNRCRVSLLRNRAVLAFKVSCCHGYRDLDYMKIKARAASMLSSMESKPRTRGIHSNSSYQVTVKKLLRY